MILYGSLDPDAPWAGWSGGPKEPEYPEMPLVPCLRINLKTVSVNLDPIRLGQDPQRENIGATQSRSLFLNYFEQACLF